MISETTLPELTGFTQADFDVFQLEELDAQEAI
jgi:uncharacterized protein YktB (UPF0637 family)